MDLFRGEVLLIILTVRETWGSSSFVISKDKTNWTTASERCTLAEPDLIFSSNQITVNMSNDITENVWIGYFRARTAFEYFGCAAKDNTKKQLKTKAIPGYCFSACDGQKIIGIFDNDCFCFGDDEIKNDATTRLPYCNLSCKNQKDALCGGKNMSTNTTYVSLYRFLGPDTAVSGNGKGNCMIYDHEGLRWANCSTHLEIICGIGYSVWIGKNKQSSRTFLGWNESTIKCFQNNTRPSSYCNTHSFQTNSTSPQFWTGIIRSQAIYKKRSNSGLLVSANAYAYTKDNLRLFTYKVSIKDTKEMKVLCEKDRNSTGISKSQSNVTPIFSLTIKERCVNLNTDDMPSNLPPSESSRVVVVVGATLSVLALVAIVMIIVLFLRKRGVDLPFLKKEKPTHSPSESRTNAGYAITGPVEIQHSTTTSQDEYAQIDLKKMINNDGAVNNTLETSDYAHDYFVLEKQEEEPYDTTQPGIQKSEPDTYNPYNKLSMEESTEYDHVGNDKTRGGIPNRKAVESENTYNTTSLGNSKLKTCTGESNNAYNMTDDADDAYNHINNPPHRMDRRVPDNDYDAF